MHAASYSIVYNTALHHLLTTVQAFLVLLDAGNTRRGWVQGKRKIHERAKGATGYDINDTRTSQIITNASISGFNRQVTVGFAYSASKAGAVLLGKTMAHFLAPWGIRSNVICPGRFPVRISSYSSLTGRLWCEDG